MADKKKVTPFPLILHVSLQDKDDKGGWLMVEEHGVAGVVDEEDGTPRQVAVYKRISTGTVKTQKNFLAESD